MWQRFASNVVANTATGASTLVFQIALTGLASRVLSRDDFSIWALAFSLAAMVPLFGINLSSVVARSMTSDDVTKPSGPLQRHAMDAATQLARRLAWWSVTFVSVLALVVGLASPQVRGDSLLLLTATTAALGASQVWQVSAQPRFGWHVAQATNWRVAEAYLVTRVVALAAAGTLVWLGWRQAPWGMALAVAAGTLAGWAWWSARHPPPWPVGGETDANTVATSKASILSLSRGFAVWAVGSAAVQYAVPPYMAVIGVGDYNAFFVAFTLNTVIVGVLGAAGGAMLAPVLRKSAVRDFDAVARWLLVAPAVTGLALLVMLGSVWWSMPTWLPRWMASLVQTVDVREFLQLLGLQTVLRSVAIAPAAVFAALAPARRLGLPTWIEVALTLAVVAPTGIMFGAHAALLVLAAVGAIAACITTGWALVTLPVARARRLQCLAAIMATQLVAGASWWMLASSSAA